MQVIWQTQMVPQIRPSWGGISGSSTTLFFGMMAALERWGGLRSPSSHGDRSQLQRGADSGGAMRLRVRVSKGGGSIRRTTIDRPTMVKPPPLLHSSLPPSLRRGGGGGGGSRQADCDCASVALFTESV